MMWMLYTAYLHARLYLRRRGMWKAVAALAVLSFLILVLTYVATYVVPGAHSYASAETGRALAALAGRCRLMVDIEDIRQRAWDFWLTIITVVAARGAGRAVVRRHRSTSGGPSARSRAGSRAPGYAAVRHGDEPIAAPLILALVRRDGAVRAQAALLAAAAAGGLGGDGRRRAWSRAWRRRASRRGLAVYLALAAIIQVAVVAHDRRRRARPVAT